MWAAGAAFLLLVAACAPPASRPVSNVKLETPSPSPTPTTPLVAAAATFHVGEVGIAYAPVALSASGGVAPYRWTVASGALPGGLTLGGDGSVAGTPTAGGTYSFTIQIADSGGSVAKLDGKIGIAAPLAASLIPSCQSYCNVELGCVDVCGSFGTLSGGIGPYTYSLTQGPLPAGTSLNGLALTGTFKGLAGWLQFTVQVSDALGAATTISPRFWMYPHISLSADSACQGRVSCQVSLTFTGGAPGPAPTVAPTNWSGAKVCGYGTVPQPCPQPSFQATLQSGKVLVTLVYQGQNSNTTGVLTVQITDGSLCGPGAYCIATTQVQVIG